MKQLYTPMAAATQKIVLKDETGQLWMVMLDI